MLQPLWIPRAQITVRTLMKTVVGAAVACAFARWVWTEVLWPREYTCIGNTVISSRKLTEQALRESGWWPWVSAEAKPSPPK
jgi:hypothetical protein